VIGDAGMMLDNQAHATINGNATHALKITAAAINEGTIESIATGTVSVGANGVDPAGNATSGFQSSGIISANDASNLTVTSDLTNTGSLQVNGGILTVQDAVSGGGRASIADGTLDFQSYADSNVSFNAANGTLELDASSANKGNGYSGVISGFTAQDQIDLNDIGFGANTTLGYLANAQNTGGELTVSDGTNTARVTLLGNYIAASFAASDAGGVTCLSPTHHCRFNPVLPLRMGDSFRAERIHVSFSGVARCSGVAGSGSSFLGDTPRCSDGYRRARAQNSRVFPVAQPGS
jgi:hypothetical protein